MTPSKPSGEASLETLSCISKNDFSTAILLCRFKTTPPTLAVQGLVKLCVINLESSQLDPGTTSDGRLGATSHGKQWQPYSVYSGWHISLVRDGGGIELPVVKSHTRKQASMLAKSQCGFWQAKRHYHREADLFRRSHGFVRARC